MNADPGAVVWSLDDESFIAIVARILPLGHDLNAVADLERFGAPRGMGWFMGSIGLDLPVEDAHIAFGHAEAVDVCQGEGRVGFAGTTIPIG